MVRAENYFRLTAMLFARAWAEDSNDGKEVIQ